MTTKRETGHRHDDCFDCHLPIESNQSHIHVGLDTFGMVEVVRNETLGLGGGFLVFPVHSAHTARSER